MSFFRRHFSSREWLKSRKEEDEALSSVWWKQSGICLMRNYVPEAAEIKFKTGGGGDPSICCREVKFYPPLPCRILKERGGGRCFGLIKKFFFFYLSPPFLLRYGCCCAKAKFKGGGRGELSGRFFPGGQSWVSGLGSVGRPNFFLLLLLPRDQERGKKEEKKGKGKGGEGGFIRKAPFLPTKLFRNKKIHPWKGLEWNLQYCT